MTRYPCQPHLVVSAVFLLVALFSHGSLWAEKPISPSEKKHLEEIGMPDGTFWGHASEAQARKLAALLCSHHNNALEKLAQMEEAFDIQETKRLINQNLVMAERILALIEETSRRQGSGEITLFFSTGTDTFAKDSPEHRRLVRFMDYLVRKSRGRTVFFISIGRSSAPGTEKENLALSERRARFPQAVIDHYLVNTPHAFYEIYGTGETQSPESQKIKIQQRHQHTRLIAFYATKTTMENPPPKTDADARSAAEASSTHEAKETADLPALPDDEQQSGNSLGMDFAWIPPGTFTMGSPKNELGRDSDETRHEVTLTRGFHMQVTEVTQSQWDTLMETNPSYYKECGGNCPVNQVCLSDIIEFIRRLNITETSGIYRLPTEAEWEYACRAGSTEAFANGPLLELACASDSNMNLMGWHNSNSGTRPHKVGQKAKNRWGLYDMHGNVWEWCMDRKGPYEIHPITDPKGPRRGALRVIRGGSWSSDDRDCRSANRLFMTECSRNAGVGFRLVMEK